MKISIFTKNQPRHISLIQSLALIADEIFAVQECDTLFPGGAPNLAHQFTVMQEYFSHVMNAEYEVFGRVRFSASNVRTLFLKSGELNSLSLGELAGALQSDLYIIFGSSYIKGPLVEFLVAHKAVNIHMGVSPYYRGAACNFWAVYDGNPDLVGSTIHLLTRGLDSGGMLFHALPRPEPCDPFFLGMRAVKAAHDSLVDAILSRTLLSIEPVSQDKRLEIRYSRSHDFTDDVAREYLDRKPSERQIGEMLKQHPARELVHARYV